MERPGSELLSCSALAWEWLKERLMRQCLCDGKYDKKSTGEGTASDPELLPKRQDLRGTEMHVHIGLKLEFQLCTIHLSYGGEHTVGMSGILDHNWHFPRYKHRLHFSLWLWSEGHTRVDSVNISTMVGWSP